MPSVAEGAANKKAGPLASDLAAGVAAISANQVVEFVKYVRLVLPLDGYVFWVRADLVSDGALYNAAVLNAVANDEPPVLGTDKVLKAPGSLHYATENKQQADSSYAVNRVVFTSEVPVNDLNAVGPNVLYIGKFQGLKFAFSSRKSFYRQADTYHYVGDAVYPVMESQLIDSVDAFPGNAPIVSNSLPLWLALNYYVQQAWEAFGNGGITLYPSFLSKDDIDPPFGTIDIPPDSTQAIAAAPFLGRTYSHSQIVRDRVKVTLWGLDNAAALDFVDFVNQYSLNWDLFGIMNQPTVRDEKAVQVELNVIAKKKTVEFEINYHQETARRIARQVIISAIPTFYFN